MPNTDYDAARRCGDCGCSEADHYLQDGSCGTCGGCSHPHLARVISPAVTEEEA